jgi:hypothetical protein
MEFVLSINRNKGKTMINSKKIVIFFYELEKNMGYEGSECKCL